MSDALWIGGPPGSGKTTVATRLARRHGLRWYNADTRTWAHRDRALAEGNDAARRWEELTPDERRADSLTDAELLEMSLHRERGPMVLDDVRRLPARPLTVAEGSVLAPALVADPSRAVWLLPTPGFQREGLARRDGQANRLYRLLAGQIERDAHEQGVTVIAIDGSLTIAETLAAVERLFAPALAAGPRASSPAERRALLREANQEIVRQIRAYFARPWANGDAETTVRAFICECGDPSCDADVELPVGVAAVRPALAPGHQPV